MRKTCKLLVLAIIVATIALPSCVKDNFDMDRLSDEVTYTGSFALPLAYSDVSFYKVMDLLDTSISLRDNDEGYLSLYYQSYVESNPVQDLLNVGNQTMTKTISLSDITSRGKRGETSLRYTVEENIAFDLFNSDAEIDSIVLKTGTFDYEINTTFGRTTRMVIEFPSITKNGRAFKDSVTFLSSDSHYQISLPLDDYKIDMTTTSRHFNEIPVRLTVSLAFPDSDPPMSGGITVSMGINNIRYKRMFGYFGYNELFFQSDTIDISLFKDNPKYYMERFFFNNPKLTVHYWNSYGVPSMFYFTELDTYLKTLDQVWDITSSNENFPMSSTNPYYVKHSSRYGYEAEDSVQLNKENSNLDQIVPNRPRWIHFKALAATNPGVHNHDNFITEDSKLRSKIDIEFPLWGYLYNFCYTDTLDVDLSNIAGKYPVSRLAVLLSMENGMPAEAFAQFYLVDENYNVLDSLITNPGQMVLEAAPVDANGRILKRTKTDTKVELTPAQINKLKNCKHMLMKAHVNTDAAMQGRLMKIYRDYGFKVNVGAEVDLDVEGSVDSLIDNVGSKNIILNSK